MSLPYDYAGELIAVELLPAAVRTTTANGTGVDISSYVGNLKAVLDIGSVTGTTPTLDFKIQDSADNSTFADVSPTIVIATQTAAGITSVGVDTRVVRRYIRAVATIGGTTPSFPCAAVLLTAARQV